MLDRNLRRCFLLLLPAEEKRPKTLPQTIPSVSTLSFWLPPILHIGANRLQTEIIADYGRYNLVYVTTVLSQSQWKVYLIHSLVAAAAVKRKCSPLLYLILFSIHVGWV